MSEKNTQEFEEIVKSLAQELDMSEDEINQLLKAEEEKEDESEDDDEKEDKEDMEEETEKSEISDIKKSISENLLKLKSLTKSETKEEPKQDLNEIFKSFDFESKIEKAVSGMKDDFQKSIETLTNTISEIKKSVDLIGNSSQGTKGMRFNTFLQKSGDSEIKSVEGKTVLKSTDRDAISYALADIIEKSTDSDMTTSLSNDLFNYQSDSSQLSSRAVMSLNKAGYIFEEQIKE